MNHLKCLGCSVFVAFCLVMLAGCNWDPPVYEVTGKVTLGGKAHKGIIVYFKEIDTPTTQFNYGVWETDSEGNIQFADNASGIGISSGTYRVTFAINASEVGTISSSIASARTGDDSGKSRAANILPSKFTYYESSPVEFEVKSGDNHFEFNIPKK